MVGDEPVDQGRQRDLSANGDSKCFAPENFWNLFMQTIAHLAIFLLTEMMRSKCRIRTMIKTSRWMTAVCHTTSNTAVGGDAAHRCPSGIHHCCPARNNSASLSLITVYWHLCSSAIGAFYSCLTSLCGHIWACLKRGHGHRETRSGTVVTVSRAKTWSKSVWRDTSHSFVSLPNPPTHFPFYSLILTTGTAYRLMR